MEHKRNLVIAAALVIATVLAIAATRLGRFRVQRRTTIQAPPARVYALLEDVRRWSEWAPWERQDPALQRRFDGPPTGVGARLDWRGNRKVGRGRVEIREAAPGQRLAFSIDFLHPFRARSQAEFLLAPLGEATELIWTLDGPMSYATKLMDMFFSMDRLVGRDLETGLAALKRAAESTPPHVAL